ncbi:dipeptidase PepV [Thalassobacillus sp. CUG 92003]|uniref:dipeptidase PepV n=1 Tax=Thalassobacillus sp. CUG 92003 TaxID=2736641 RepID=UPI0015E7B909|nr:dipeptidase PepV [Thalassobacillus sp. CUG 92003]
MTMPRIDAQHVEKYCTKLFKLLSIPSIHEPHETYPFGASIDDCLNTMLEMALADGFKVKNVSGYAGHIEFGEGSELIGVLGHLDVVPAGEGWHTPAFQPVVREGKIYARGAQDDKGPVMAAYMAMKILKDSGFVPKKRIRLILGTDEERDGRGIQHYFDHEEMPEFGFSPDAAFPVINAEKGLIDCSITFDEGDLGAQAPVVIHSLHGGDRLNMVPEQAHAFVSGDVALQDHVDDYFHRLSIAGDIKADSQGYWITVFGKASHASKPDQGANAIVHLLALLQSLPIAAGASQFIEMLQKRFSSVLGEGFELHTRDDISGELTMNLGTLAWKQGDKLKAGCNIRYPVTETGEVILQKVSTEIDRLGGDVEVLDHLLPLYVDEQDDDVQTLLHAYNHHMNMDAWPISIGGATYARLLKHGVAFGALFPGSPDTAHQKDEHILISDMKQAIAIYMQTLYDLTAEEES